MTQALLPGVTLRAAQPQELPAVTDMIVTNFAPDENDPEEVRHFVDDLRTDPTWSPENLRVAVRDDQVASLVLIADRQISVGHINLRVGGVGAVCTRTEYSRLGYSSALVTHTREYLEQAGYDLALVQAVPGYFPKYGFANVWPRQGLEVASEDAAHLATLNKAGGTWAHPTLGQLPAVRPYEPADLAGVMAVYEKHFGGRPGTMIRDERYWRWRLHQTDKLRVAVDRWNSVRGYLAGTNTRSLEEVASLEPAATASLLADAAWLTPAGQSQIRFRCPPDSTFARQARELIKSRLTTDDGPSRNWMARILNLRTTLSKLGPELAARLAASRMYAWRGTLLFVTDIGQAAVSFVPGQALLDNAPGPAMVCHIPQHRLAQLIFGYLTVAETATLPEVRLPPEAMQVLSIVFASPLQAFLAGIDWF